MIFKFFLTCLLSLVGSSVVMATEASFMPFDTPGVLTTVSAHLFALKSGRMSEAYHKMTTEDFRRFTSLQDLATFVIKLPPLTNSRQLCLEDLSFNGSSALYRGIILDQLGTPCFSIVYHLVHEDKWRIQGLEIMPYNIATRR